jgi:rhodanese-related sulfurtransferase
MIRKIGELLGIKPGADFKQLIANGAVVVDVRSKSEFTSGHLKGSVNIPLLELSKSIAKINKSKPVIVCCASGMRSSSAKGLLKEQGFDVYNGGGWQSLQQKIK